MTVSCICGKTFPRDPRLEIPCSPGGCGAAIGQACRRPSGHVLSTKNGFGEYHAVRRKRAFELIPCFCLEQWEAAQRGETSIQISLL